MHSGQKEQSRTDMSGRALTQPDNRESERTHGTQMMAQLDQNMNQTPKGLESMADNERNLLVRRNEDYADGNEGRIKGLSGKESLKGAPSKQGFLIGEQEEDPGTQRDDPSAYTHDEIENGVEGVKLAGKASRTQRQSISAAQRPG